ncbi:hypothetical protein [Ekhidna sp.]|uniref:hypothetical protein n=1 Tax=Ekhidna sp. TaxID=2608089 RepID=UPI003CCBD5DF
MAKRLFYFTLTLVGFCSVLAQEPVKTETKLAGVYQGKTLFVQNPYDKQSKEFCVESVYVNERRLNLNYRLSALKIDFDGFDMYTPVKIRLEHRDTLCVPVIINPEAILFHTIFRFSEISLTDSALVWETKGETGVGTFEIERLNNGIWIEKESMPSRGRYEGARYTYFPNLEEGANKYRIKYIFPRGSRTRYLYSREVDFDFYPEPVEFKPKSAKTRLYLSRSTHYEIYDQARRLVHEGQGNEIDVTVLRAGTYVIYFNGKDPGTFIKE